MPEPLEIIYQDQWLVAVNKPAGHLVHPADKPQPDDLVAMKILRDQIGERVHPIHRIDRPTCGLLIFGIDRDVATYLHKAFETRAMKKSYWAVIDGIPEQQSWSCEEPIQKTEGKPWRDAHTDFKVLEVSEKDKVTLVEAIPHSGRYHQIRRHLLHAGYPIVGDYLYAGVERSDYFSEKYFLETRMLLQAKTLKFEHPKTEETLVITCPDDPKFTQFF